MLFLWIVSITRRHILLTIWYMIIIVLIRNFLHRKNVSFFKLIVYFGIFFIMLASFFPFYVDQWRIALVESYAVISTGQTTLGTEDGRLSLTDQKPIIDLFMKNLFLVTGMMLFGGKIMEKDKG